MSVYVCTFVCVCVCVCVLLCLTPSKFATCRVAYSLLEDITTEPRAHDFSTDIVRVWLSGYILQHALISCACGSVVISSNMR
jgi:hypothetical protein